MQESRITHRLPNLQEALRAATFAKARILIVDHWIVMTRRAIALPDSTVNNPLAKDKLCGTQATSYQRFIWGNGLIAGKGVMKLEEE
jgi:hypothetical protein